MSEDQSALGGICTPQWSEARQVMDLKVRSLLNMLTTDNFDAISDQIIRWTNMSEQEKDASTLMQVIELIFERAKDQRGSSKILARLCQKMKERVSSNIQDETVPSADGQPITGGLLFRKYLLHLCQKDFERGWSAKEAVAALAASKAGDNKAAEAAGYTNGEVVFCSEEYYAAAIAKRQGLGLVRFIGELFKIQILTERIMHSCINKLLINAESPKEEEIESLCELLATVGQSLDTQKSKTRMDIYFERMLEMSKGENTSSRMQYMLQDVIKLRLRHWQARTSAAPHPSTITALHEQAKRDEATLRGTIQRGGYLRGGDSDHDYDQQADGWNIAGGNTAARLSAEAGDLSQFIKIFKPTSLSFGPPSVFGKANSKPRDAKLFRANSSNMFGSLNVAEGVVPPQSEAVVGRTVISRKPSMGIGPGELPALQSENVHRKLVLAPKTEPTAAVTEKGNDEGTPEAAFPTTVTLSEADVQKKVKEDIKEYLGVENVGEAIVALETLPTEHRHIFVDKMLNAAFDGGNKVVLLAEKLFAAIHKQQACSIEAVERGMLPTVEMADDISIDVPKTYEWLARIMFAAGFDMLRAEEMARKISMLGEPKIQPRDQLMLEFDKVSA